MILLSLSALLLLPIRTYEFAYYDLSLGFPFRYFARCFVLVVALTRPPKIWRATCVVNIYYLESGAI